MTMIRGLRRLNAMLTCGLAMGALSTRTVGGLDGLRRLHDL